MVEDTVVCKLFDCSAVCWLPALKSSTCLQISLGLHETGVIVVFCKLVWYYCYIDFRKRVNHFTIVDWCAVVVDEDICAFRRVWIQLSLDFVIVFVIAWFSAVRSSVLLLLFVTLLAFLARLISGKPWIILQMFVCWCLLGQLWYIVVCEARCGFRRVWLNRCSSVWLQC